MHGPKYKLRGSPGLFLLPYLSPPTALKDFQIKGAAALLGDNPVACNLVSAKICSLGVITQFFLAFASPQDRKVDDSLQKHFYAEELPRINQPVLRKG